MARFDLATLVVAFLYLLSSFSAVFAAPAARFLARRQTVISWPGHEFGTDRWGLVLNPPVVQPASEPQNQSPLITPSFSSEVPTFSPAANPATSPEPVYTPPADLTTDPSVTNPTTTSSSSTTPKTTTSSPAAAETPAVTSSDPLVTTTTSTTKPVPSSTSVFSTTSPALTSHSTSSPHSSPQPTSSVPAPAMQPAAAQPGGSDIQQYLSIHNTLRAKHGAVALTWDNNLASKAEQWANGCQFHHSEGKLGPFGENLAAGSGDFTIADGLGAWEAEESSYNAENPQASHYTQMIWKGSTSLGCAKVTCPAGTIFQSSFGPAIYIVCEYSPQGNVIGEFSQNVQS